MAKPTIEQTCRKYRNEDPHTEHVAELALRVFDGGRPALNMRAADRPLLEAACRLHDVGYASDWRDHGRASAEIVLREGVRGLSTTRLRYVVAAILLHRRSFRPLLEDPLVRAPGDRRRALQLAAILQVADGLDHGHVQDLHVTAVACRRGVLCVGLDGGWYEHNLAWARRKTELWKEVFPVAIELHAPERPPGLPLFAGLFRGNESSLGAARKLLYSQLRTILDNEAGTVAGRTPEPLHDVRVAIRRFRAALRLFRPVLPIAAAAELDRRFSTLAKQTGPARDSDVWIAFLKRTAESRTGPDGDGWSSLLDSFREENRTLQDELGGVLRGPQYAAAIGRALTFLKIELPELQRHAAPHPAQPFLGRKLARAFHRIGKRAHLRKSRQPDDMHALRKRCRRERYWAEFAAPMFGEAVNGFAGRLKDAADVLGDIHDMDVYLERLRAAAVSPPKALEKHLKALRRRYTKGFVKVWDRLFDAGRRKELLAELRSAPNRSPGT